MSDLGERLVLARTLLARTLDDLRGGTLPVPTGAANARDRDEALAAAAKADGIAHFLRHPPRPVAGLLRGIDAILRETREAQEARVVAEQDRILDEARDREQGEEP